MDRDESEEPDFIPQKVRVLLIEDDPDDAEILGDLLRQLGCTEQVARDGLLTLGLRRLQSEQFDLVFLDLSLPDSWGIGTLRRLRKSFPGLPVVLMTGAKTTEIAEEAEREGAVACLFKQQLDADVLRSVLARIRGS